MLWWGYVKHNGDVCLWRYYRAADTDYIYECVGIADGIKEPFEASSKEQAFEILKQKLNERSSQKRQHDSGAKD